MTLEELDRLILQIGDPDGILQDNPILMHQTAIDNLEILKIWRLLDEMTTKVAIRELARKIYFLEQGRPDPLYGAERRGSALW